MTWSGRYISRIRISKKAYKVLINLQLKLSSLFGACINIHVQFIGATGNKANLGEPVWQKERMTFTAKYEGRLSYNIKDTRIRKGFWEG